MAAGNIKCETCDVGCVSEEDCWKLVAYSEDPVYFCCSDCLLQFVEEQVVADHIFDEVEDGRLRED